MSLTTIEVQQGVEHTIDLIHRLRSSLVSGIEFEIVENSITLSRPRSILDVLRGRPKEDPHAIFELRMTFSDRHDVWLSRRTAIKAPLDASKIQQATYKQCADWLNLVWTDTLRLTSSEGEKVRKIVDSIENTGLLLFKIDPVELNRETFIQVRSYGIDTDELSHFTYHRPLFFIRDYKKILLEHRAQSHKGSTPSTPPTT